MPTPDQPTAVEMLEEVAGLATGLTAALLPLFLISVPGVILLLVLPAALLVLAAALPVAIGAALLAPPYLLVRAVRRRRGKRTRRPSAGTTSRPVPAVRPAG
jgi:Flp pilus assembly protein TadB